jgi:dolichol-phosphate mannosyltransferase
LAAVDERIEVLHRPSKLGLGTAYTEAFRRALTQNFDYVLQMDADFSHDPRYLPALLAAARMPIWCWDRGTRRAEAHAIGLCGADSSAVLATWWPGWGWVSGYATPRGYRVFRRSALESLDLENLDLRGYSFQIEVVYQIERRGLRIKEVPIIFVERVTGVSKMSRRSRWRPFSTSRGAGARCFFVDGILLGPSGWLEHPIRHREQGSIQTQEWQAHHQDAAIPS